MASELNHKELSDSHLFKSIIIIPFTHLGKSHIEQRQISKFIYRSFSARIHQTWQYLFKQNNVHGSEYAVMNLN